MSAKNGYNPADMITHRYWCTGVAGLLLCLGFAWQVAAQQPVQSVTGTVRDSARTPLSGASIEIGERSATTNAQGVFRVDSLRPGTYFLAVRLVGYLPLRTMIVVGSAGSPRLEYVLRSATFTLPGIVVEAKRTGVFGTVSDSALQALAGARIELAGPGGGEIRTDSAGRFAFPRAHNGQFALRVRMDGFAERRLWLTLKRNEGRELAVRLTPAITVNSRVEDEAFAGLRARLAFNLTRERISGEELVRYGSLGLCDVNRITEAVTPLRTERAFRMRDQQVLLVLNGSTVFESFPLYAICSWRADEVELVEFGSSLCRDATRTIPDLVHVWCSGIPPSGRPRRVTRSITGAPGLSTQGNAGIPFVVIWEKR